MKIKRLRRPNFTEEQYTKVLSRLYANWKESNGTFKITQKTLEEAIEYALPAKEQNPVWSQTIVRFKERFDALFHVAAKPKKIESLKEVKSVLMRPSTIDLHMSALVRTELKHFETAIVSRISLMLSEHETSIRRMLDYQEKRLINFWSDTPNDPRPAEEQLEEVKESISKLRRKRVLIACLHENQHALVKEHLRKFLHEIGHENSLEVTLLVQEQSIKGYNKDAYDHVILLPEAIGHVMQSKVVSRFGSDKCTTAPGKGPVSAARGALNWYKNHLEAIS